MVKPELVKMAGLLSELALAIACFGPLRLGLEAAHHASLLLQTDFFHVKYLIFFPLHCIYFVQSTRVAVRKQLVRPRDSARLNSRHLHH